MTFTKAHCFHYFIPPFMILLVFGLHEDLFYLPFKVKSQMEHLTNRGTSQLSIS